MYVLIVRTHHYVDAMAESVFNSWKFYRLDLEIVLIDGQIVIISFYS